MKQTKYPGLGSVIVGIVLGMLGFVVGIQLQDKSIAAITGALAATFFVGGLVLIIRSKKEPKSSAKLNMTQPQPDSAFSKTQTQNILLERYNALASEYDALQKRCAALEQQGAVAHAAQPAAAPPRSEVEERSLLKLSQAMEEHREVIAAQKKRIEELENVIVEQNFRIVGLEHQIKFPEARNAGAGKGKGLPFEVVNPAEISPTVSTVDAQGPLYQKRIVFTGTCVRSRRELMQIAVNCGALLQSGVTTKTSYLVVGEQDPELVGEDGLSTKQEKARQFNAAGKAEIREISEEDFLRLAGAAEK